MKTNKSNTPLSLRREIGLPGFVQADANSGACLFKSDDVCIPNRPLRELHLFAGAGGGILGGILCGHACVCAVEIEPYPRSVLLARQRDGILPKFPIWDDIRTFNGRPWRGKVDIVCGGFPCQDISSAGKGAGIEGERSGLWSEMARIIREIRPRFVFVENSPMLVSRGLGVVLGDLAKMGYNARWGVLGVSDSLASHNRERIWITAYTAESGRGFLRFNNTGSKARGETGARINRTREEIWAAAPIPVFRRVDDGLARRMDRVRWKAIGNGQVPAVAALAWKILSQRD